MHFVDLFLLLLLLLLLFFLFYRIMKFFGEKQFLTDKEIVSDFTFYWCSNIFFRNDFVEDWNNFSIFLWKQRDFGNFAKTIFTEIYFCVFNRIESAFWNSKYSKNCCETERLVREVSCYGIEQCYQMQKCIR